MIATLCSRWLPRLLPLWLEVILNIAIHQLCQFPLLFRRHQAFFLFDDFFPRDRRWIEDVYQAFIPDQNQLGCSVLYSASRGPGAHLACSTSSTSHPD